jgi:hypothetical protein
VLYERANKVPDLAAPYNDFHLCVVYETEIHKKTRMFTETQRVKELDNRRDPLFIGIGEQLSAAKKSGNPTVRTAGIELGNIYHKYKGAGQKALDQETADIAAFIRDCRVPEMATYLNTLSLVRSDLDELEKVTEELDDIFDSRTLKQQDELDKGTMTAARAKTDDAYLSLQMTLNSLLVVEKDQEQRALLDEIATGLIAYINKAAKGKRKKSDGGGGGDTPEPKPGLTPIVHVVGQRSRISSEDPAGAAGYMTADVREEDYGTVCKLKTKFKGSMLLLTPDPSVEAVKLPFNSLSEVVEEQPMSFVFDRPSGDAYFSRPIEFVGDEPCHASLMSKDGKTELIRFEGMMMPRLVTVKGQ